MNKGPDNFCRSALWYAEKKGWRVFPVHGKFPIIKDWVNAASTDRIQIETWWRQYPGAGIGIATGHLSGFWVLDCDPKNGGGDSLFYLQSKYGLLPDTPTSITGNNGQHHLFSCNGGPTIRNSAGKIGPGLDVRGEGGFIVAPPSIHPNGQAYQWELSSRPDEIEIATAPDWLIALATAKPESKSTQTIGSKIPEGQRETYLSSFAGTMRRRGASERAIEAALNVINAEQCDPPLTEKDIQKISKSIAKYEPDKILPVNKPTDDELRDRWLLKAPLTGWGLGEWKRYSNGVWNAISEDQIAGEIIKTLEEAKSEGIKPSNFVLNSVAELARLKVVIPNDQWDADPDIIVCQNGVLHIESMSLQPHSEKNHVTSALPFDYDPSARADVWQFFLYSTISEAEDFLQEFAGYCLTPDTHLETAIWLYGPPGSGKSTFIEGIQAMLGEKTIVLGLADIERSRFALGNLQGKTLAVASEQPAMFIQSSHILNALISGEKLTIERKFKDPFNMRAQVKLCWSMNELPRVPDAGNGLFRRVKVIKLPVLAEEDRDPCIKEAIKNEGAGILNWALAGLKRLKERGYFEIPSCVRDATQDFQLTNDIPAVFVNETCFLSAGSKVRSGVLYQHYSDWCFRNGHKPQSSTSIAAEWERLGFEKRREATGIFWHGIELRANEIP